MSERRWPGPGRCQGRHAGDTCPQAPGQPCDGGAGATGWKGGPPAGLGQRAEPGCGSPTERELAMELHYNVSASTWALVTQTETDPWTCSFPQAQCEKPAFVNVGRPLFCAAFAVRPWDRDRAQNALSAVSVG